MPTLMISTPTNRRSLIARLFAELTARTQSALIPPSPPTGGPDAAAGDGPHCPLVMLQMMPHPRLRHLETAHFAGGWVVVPRGHFKEDELAVFLPEGARLPDYLLKRAGLWDYASGYGTLRGPEGNRVAWRKVGGVLSYGVLLKVLNDPAPIGTPSALLFGPKENFSGATLFHHKDCCGRFLGVE